MSINKYRPHVFVLPEDDADRQIVGGFVLHPRVVAKNVQVVAPAGGWPRVLETFVDEYVPLLRQYSNAHVVMVVDFDGTALERLRQFDAQIPEDVRDRAFVIGPRGQPEDLKRAIGTHLEAIGRSLADDCDEDVLGTWGHVQLCHNEPERMRLVEVVKPFLFG